jgi:hypothetical protein
MIVLRRAEKRQVEKTIPPGQTEEFFNLDLNEYDSFDWQVKSFGDGLKGVTKISSLYNDDNIESTAYACLGKRFATDINVFVSNGDRCVLEIQNNDTLVIKCIVRLKTF